MNTSKSMHEQISAFANGELAPAAEAAVLAALRAPAKQAIWDDYHHIGDILRSVEMAAAVRPDFATRMAVRLASEPVYMADTAVAAAASATVDGRHAPAQVQWLKRLAMPASAVAAAVMLTIVAVPRMAGLQSAGDLPVPGLSKPEALAQIGTANGVVLRDPRVEEYLLAHQRFSPSVFSSAQFARSAAFATDSLK